MGENFYLHQDHPRVCGEHLVQDLGERPGRGSSPRMRGALQGAIQLVLALGIIPAYAGSTCVV